MEWTFRVEARTGWGEVTTYEIGALHRNLGDLTAGSVGLTLAEAKTLLSELQQWIVRTQVDEYITGARVCADCLMVRRLRDRRTRTLQTLFGSVKVEAPHICLCPCVDMFGMVDVSFSPLAQLLPDRCTSELRRLGAALRCSAAFPPRQSVAGSAGPATGAHDAVPIAAAGVRVAGRFEEARRQPAPAHLPRALRPVANEIEPVVAEVRSLSRQFLGIMHRRRPREFDRWQERLSRCEAAEMQSFARSLRADLPAVRAAFTLPWSNGQTEGHVNWLTFLKRQIYGRASVELLRTSVRRPLSGAPSWGLRRRMPRYLLSRRQHPPNGQPLPAQNERYPP